VARQTKEIVQRPKRFFTSFSLKCKIGHGKLHSNHRTDDARFWSEQYAEIQTDDE
jgi:hypothetical protein